MADSRQVKEGAQGSSLLLTAIPLLVWLLADTIWGTLPGLAIGGGVVVLHALWSLIQRRRIESGLVLDLAFMAFLGLPDVLPHQIISPDLTRALVELAFALLLAPALFGRLPRSASTGFSIPEGLKPLFTRLVAVMAVFLLLHALLALAAYLAAPAISLALILEMARQLALPAPVGLHALLDTLSGPVFWILPAAFLIILVARTRARLRAGNLRPETDPADEWLRVVDQEGREVARARRSLLHNRPDLMHHVVHLLVLHPQTGDILLQKRRADRAVAPGLWDSAAAGHVCAGESAESALQRECAEEIGYKIISVPPPNSLQSGQDEIRWIGCYRMQKQSECEYCDVWSLISAGPFRPDRSEMDALEWFSREDCLRLEEEGLITASAIRDLALATGAGSP